MMVFICVGCGRSSKFCLNFWIIENYDISSANHCGFDFCIKRIHLDIRCMVKIPHKYIFTFHKSHKSWRKDAFPPQRVFQECLQEKELCSKAIDDYLNEG